MYHENTSATLVLSLLSRLLFVCGFLVSKETVVLRRWDSETKTGFYQTN